MSKEEKMMILEMVAQGKITPEQGAELLRAVGSGRGAFPSLDEGISKIRSTAEEAAKRAEKTVEDVREKAQERAEEAAKMAAEIGEKAGVRAEETAVNLSKLLSNMFSFGFGHRGPEFEFHDEIKGEFPLEGEIDVSIDTTNGRVTVETWDGPGFLCDVKKKISARDEGEAKKLLENAYEFVHDGLAIKARAKKNDGDLWGRNASVGFALKLPKDRKVSLNLDSANGRIEILGTAGTRLDADTANGRVEAARCDYDSVKIDTANGRIDFQGSARSLELDTANGRIEARLRGHGSWKLDTANGRIEAEIKRDENTAYEIDVSSVMGKLDVSGLGETEVLVDDTKERIGSKRYKARTKGFESAPQKATLKASSAIGRVTVSLV